MTISKKFLITTRSSEVLIVRPVLRAANTFCPACGTEREMLSLDDAVAVTSIGTRELLSYVDAGSFHSTETVHGRLLICREPLEKFIKGEKR
jgi:hypothetical protein